MTATEQEDAQQELAPLVRYNVTEKEISQLREDYAALSFETPESYEVGRKAIAHLRSLRTSVEARRKELKESSLRWGRLVDSAAKRLTTMLEEIEEPLKGRRNAVDKTIERAKRVEEEARIAEERRQLDEQRKVFEEAQRKADADRAAREAAERAERERVEAEQKAEREQLAAERREIEAAQRQISEQREATERAERERLAKIEEERLAAEQAERDRIEAERRAAEEKAAAEAEAARLEAMKPDLERLTDWANRIRALAPQCPEMRTERGAKAAIWSTERLLVVAAKIEEFVLRGGV